MKTLKPQITSSKTVSQLDFSDEIEGLDSDQQKELLSNIGEALVEQILSKVADAESPIDGEGPFEKLSEKYAKYKLDETGSKSPNLDLTGSMLNSLDYKIKKEGVIEIGVYGDDAPKADGHNNLSGKSLLPRRQFLPDEGQSFNSDIEDLIKETIQFYKADNLEINKQDLSDIKTKSDLYDLLKSEFGDMSRKDLRMLALSSRKITESLDDFDLLDLL